MCSILYLTECFVQQLLNKVFHQSSSLYFLSFRSKGKRNEINLSPLLSVLPQIPKFPNSHLFTFTLFSGKKLLRGQNLSGLLLLLLRQPIYCCQINSGGSYKFLKQQLLSYFNATSAFLIFFSYWFLSLFRFFK